MDSTEDDIPEMLRQLEPPQLPTKKRRFFSLDPSPLARKIIVFNLIALGILLTSILYLNQSEDGVVNYRRASLNRQAEIVAGELAEMDIGTGLSDAQLAKIALIARPTGAIVQVFDHDKNLIWKSPPLEAVELAPVSESGTSAFSAFMQSIWGNVVDSSSEVDAQSLQSRFNDLVAQIGDEGVEHIIVHDSQTYVIKILPIGPSGGYVLLSTLHGEIDAVIRRSREQILQMFVLAILSSIVLSIVLANSIARPLRRLSAAAETTHHGDQNRLNPERVDIPDLTMRPDEIGDLSRAMRNMSNALLAQIDETKAFSADVSHEIKNPLTSLRSAVETMDYALDDESRSALLGVIKNDVDRIDRLVTDISNASRLEAEMVRANWEAVDLDRMLAGMAQYHRENPAGAEIRFNSDGSPHVIKGLESRLAQIFTNLITNALSFVPEGGWVAIDIETRPDGAIEVRVSDNGPGIPPDNLKDVFSRFYSERPETQFGEHSGLGLAISKQIVEAHGGTIQAQNSPDGGAVFTVVFK